MSVIYYDHMCRGGYAAKGKEIEGAECIRCEGMNQLNIILQYNVVLSTKTDEFMSYPENGHGPYIGGHRQCCLFRNSYM